MLPENVRHQNILLRSGKEEVNPFSYFNIKEGSILKYIDENTYDTKYCLIDYIDLENN